jgi:hypothetical protein
VLKYTEFGLFIMDMQKNRKRGGLTQAGFIADHGWSRFA